jgi:tRNA (guanine37-N1)-methyltransferase
MVVLDGVVRLLPGALGHPDSNREESFENGLLDHPHYTRPPEFRGMRVPEVLVSGNHKQIEAWRQAKALERTRERRRDLFARWQAGRGVTESRH